MLLIAIGNETKQTTAFTLLADKILGYTLINIPGGAYYATIKSTIDINAIQWLGNYSGYYITGDGNTWIEGNRPFDSQIIANPVVTSSGVYVALAQNSTPKKSIDGVNWSTISVLSGFDSESIAIVNDHIIITDDQNNLRVSLDGINWTSVTISNADSLRIAVGNSYSQNIQYFPISQKYVYYNVYGGYLLYSTDLINWNKSVITNENSYDDSNNYVVEHNSLYQTGFIVSTDTAVYYSTDLQNWTQSTTVGTLAPNEFKWLLSNNIGTTVLFTSNNAYEMVGFQESGWTAHLNNNGNSTLGYPVKTINAVFDELESVFVLTTLANYDNSNTSYLRVIANGSSNWNGSNYVIYENQNLTAAPYKGDASWYHVGSSRYESIQFLVAKNRSTGRRVVYAKDPYYYNHNNPSSFNQITTDINVFGLGFDDYPGIISYINGLYVFTLKHGDYETPVSLATSKNGLSWKMHQVPGNYNLWQFAGPYKKTIEVQAAIGNQAAHGAEVLAPVNVYTVPRFSTASLNKISIKNNSAHSMTYDLALLDAGQELNQADSIKWDSQIGAGATIDITTGLGTFNSGKRVTALPSSVDVVDVKVYGTETKLPVYVAFDPYDSSSSTSFNYSSNYGVTWTSSALNAYYTSIEFFNGKFLGLGQGIGISDNGGTWKQVEPSGIWSQLLIHNNMAFAVGSPGFKYSTDGTNWHSVPGITYSNGLYVANNTYFLSSNTSLYRSTDGINWTSVTTGLDYVYGVSYDGGKYIAWSGYSTNGISYSTDGINWTYVSGIGSIWYQGYYDNKFIALSRHDNYGDQYNMYVSTDGVNWTTHNINQFTNAYIQNIIYSNNKYVMYISQSRNGYSFPYALASTDGDNWVDQGFSHHIYNVKKVQNYYFADDSNGHMYYSTDGLAWTQINLPTDGSSEILYVNGHYFAKNYNCIGISSNGIDWTVSSIGTHDNINITNI